MTAGSVDVTVPFHAGARRYGPWADDVVDVVREVALLDEFILKSSVAKLERLIASRVGREHAVATSAGTSALTLALSALSIGGGDEVVTPAFSFIASAGAIALVGATPVFADVDYDTCMLDLDAAAAAVTGATRALLPVHLFNCGPPMAAYRRLATRFGLGLVEDSAVSLGAEIDGAPAGSYGDVAVFSFYPGKPLGGIGDGGMIVTDDAVIASLCRMRRNHGQDPSTRFLHHSIGWNSRMDEICAAFLLRRLPHLAPWLDRRRALANAYNTLLEPLAPELLTPPGGFEKRAVYTYVVRAQRREELCEHLRGSGIETMVYYPRPLHLQPVFAGLGHRAGEFPNAERLARECVALPLYPEMADSEVEYVASSVSEFYRGRT